MSTCPQCYTGTCKRHKYQDHGRSQVKSANAELTLQKMYDQLVGSKLQKLQAEAEKDPSRKHTKEFRKKLDASRDKSLRKSHKSHSKLANVDVTGSGLNPQALAAIYGEDSDEDRKKAKKRKKKNKQKHEHSSISGRKRHRSDLDSSDDSSDESHHRHKRSSSSRKHSRHHKKSHDKKKHKRKSEKKDQDGT